MLILHGQVSGKMGEDKNKQNMELKRENKYRHNRPSKNKRML